MMPTQEASPEELEVGDGLGVVTHGVAELDHGLAEVGQAAGVHLKLARLHAYTCFSSATPQAIHQGDALGLGPFNCRTL